MKNLKSLIVFIGLLLFAGNAIFAQGFGVRAGVNLQNINGKDANGDKLENKLIPGFHVGVNYEIPVGTDIYFQPGLLFSTKGAKSEGVTFTINYNDKLTLSYIELPLNIVFKPLLGTGHMLLGFGPYLAYGISGKYTYESDIINDESDVEFKNELTESDMASDKYFVKALDAGANFIIGYEMASMFSVQLNAQLGLIGIDPKTPDDDKTSFKNTGFGLSLGYRF